MVAQDVTPKKEKSKIKPNYKYMRDKDREMVKGIFRFHEVPGGLMSFVFKAYKEDPVERFDLVDGQVYTIPLGVARHLNKNCWYPEYEYTQGEKGVHGGFNHMTGHIMRIGKKIRRCSFQSLEFVDIDDITPDEGKLVTVETVGI